MKIRRFLAIGGVLAVAGLTTAGGALAATPGVSVRVEGLNRTLLPAKTVHAPSSGSITKGGAPAGGCSADSAAGALDVATHHRWNATWSATYSELSVTSIFKEAHPFSSKDYWSIWVNGQYASSGICGLKPKRGEQLLFAAIPQKGTIYPLIITAPKHATVGKAFAVKAISYGSGSHAKPLSGVKVGGAVTNAKGIAMVTATKAGTLKLTGTRAKYIRDEATVKVAR